MGCPEPWDMGQDKFRAKASFVRERERIGPESGCVRGRVSVCVRES